MKRFLRLFEGFTPKNRKKAAPRAQLRIEALEDRWVPSAVRGVTGFALGDLGQSQGARVGARIGRGLSRG